MKAKLGTTQAMLETIEKEVSLVASVVKDLEHVNLELRSACFAKDEELVFMQGEVSCHTGLVEENVHWKNEKVDH